MWVDSAGFFGRSVKSAKVGRLRGVKGRGYFHKVYMTSRLSATASVMLPGKVTGTSRMVVFSGGLRDSRRSC